MKRGTQFYLPHEEHVSHVVRRTVQGDRRFRVVDPKGHPVQGAAAVQLQQRDPSGGANTQTLHGIESSMEGYVPIDMLGSGVSSQVTFEKSGYLDASSSEATGKPGELLPEETVILYPATTLIARLVNGDGTPAGPAEVLCRTRYGNGEEQIHKTAVDGDGWFSLDRCLPATRVDLDVYLSPEISSDSNTALASLLGTVPDNIRRDMLQHEIRSAVDTHSPHASLSGVVLVEDTENDLGEITLTGNPPAATQ